MQWVRSSFQSSNDGTHCAEARRLEGGTVEFRSSLIPDRSVFLTESEWTSLLAGVRNGDFDAV